MRFKGKNDNASEVPEEANTASPETSADAPAETADSPVPENAAGSEQPAPAETQAEDPRDQQIADLSDKYIRLMAEYDNFRRRTRQEKTQLYEQSVTDVITEWLPVVDNLERAIAASSSSENEEAKKILDGLNLVMRQVEKTLEKLNVVTIDAQGQTFDPNFHAAVAHVEDEAYGSSEIVEVLQKGYARDNKVIRHAIVKVAN